MLTTQLDTVDQLTDSLVNDQSSLKHTVATPNHRNAESVLRKNRRRRDACVAPNTMVCMPYPFNNLQAIIFLPICVGSVHSKKYFGFNAEREDV